VTKEDCDARLRDLALLLPSAGIQVAEVDRMLDLYFGLWREAGLTLPMLNRAIKTYVMTPRNGRSRFFPDPGEIAEQVGEEARERRKALKALMRALEILDAAKDAPPPDGPPMVDIRAKLKELGLKPSVEAFQAHTVAERQPDAPRQASSGRKSTNAAELLASLKRRQNSSN
jgi:hypothetical protein